MLTLSKATIILWPVKIIQIHTGIISLRTGVILTGMYLNVSHTTKRFCLHSNWERVTIALIWRIISTCHCLNANRPLWKQLLWDDGSASPPAHCEWMAFGKEMTPVIRLSGPRSHLLTTPSAHRLCNPIYTQALAAAGILAHWLLLLWQPFITKNGTMLEVIVFQMDRNAIKNNLNSSFHSVSAFHTASLPANQVKYLGKLIKNTFSNLDWWKFYIYFTLI